MQKYEQIWNKFGTNYFRSRKEKEKFAQKINSKNESFVTSDNQLYEYYYLKINQSIN